MTVDPNSIDLPGFMAEHLQRAEPDLLRSLDALHLAAALDLGDDLDGIITYDERLASAAAALGIAVIAPA